MTDNHNTQDSSRIVLILAGATLCMFAFGFLLVPLYDVFCNITGINGKTNSSSYVRDGSMVVDSERLVQIRFVATNHASMPWQFAPNDKKMKVHPGQSNQTSYYVFNASGKDMVGQAVPSVVPARAADYIRKMECFCFSRQPLASGEQKDMGLSFVISPDLPANINEITLNYTLFDVAGLEKTPVSDLASTSR